MSIYVYRHKHLIPVVSYLFPFFFYCFIPYCLLLLSFLYTLYYLFTISVMVSFSQRISHVYNQSIYY